MQRREEARQLPADGLLVANTLTLQGASETAKAAAVAVQKRWRGWQVRSHGVMSHMNIAAFTSSSAKGGATNRQPGGSGGSARNILI